MCNYHPKIEDEWAALSPLPRRYRPCVLIPTMWMEGSSRNGWSRTVLVGSDDPPLPLHKGHFWLGELETEQRPGEYLMTKRLWTPLYTTVWLINAASSQTGLYQHSEVITSTPALMLECGVANINLIKGNVHFHIWIISFHWSKLACQLGSFYKVSEVCCSLQILIWSLMPCVLAQDLFAAAVTGNGSPERSGFSWSN